MRKLLLVILITVVFVAIEIFGGLIARSIAIMSDAAHLVSDALGIVISIIALKIAEREVDNKSTFGYHRAEVLGALAAYFSYGVLLSGWFMKRLLEFLTHKWLMAGWCLSFRWLASFLTWFIWAYYTLRTSTIMLICPVKVVAMITRMERRSKRIEILTLTRTAHIIIRRKTTSLTSSPMIIIKTMITKMTIPTIRNMNSNTLMSMVQNVIILIMSWIQINRWTQVCKPRHLLSRRPSLRMNG